MSSIFTTFSSVTRFKYEYFNDDLKIFLAQDFIFILENRCMFTLYCCTLLDERVMMRKLKYATIYG